MISIDTNVLVYAADDDEPAKQSTAKTVLIGISAVKAVLGLQVIGELQNVLRRKLRQPPWTAAQNARNLLHAFESFPSTETAAEEALTLMAAGRLSYWDALLLVSAREAGVTILLSEDMQDGLRLGSIEVVNPFGADGGPSARVSELLRL